ncbi:Fur family transcriptional regulator [Chloroflexota bacterium]
MQQQGDIAKKLSRLRYRMTPQRAMISSAIEDSNDHISAEEIYSQIIEKYPQVNISTVYRTLELLKRLNLVTETDFGSGRVRYHAGEKGHHHHLVCQKCGAIIDLDESALSSLKDYLKEAYRFVADLKHLAIFGYCESCQQ